MRIRSLSLAALMLASACGPAASLSSISPGLHAAAVRAATARVSLHIGDSTTACAYVPTPSTECWVYVVAAHFSADPQDLGIWGATIDTIVAQELPKLAIPTAGCVGATFEDGGDDHDYIAAGKETLAHWESTRLSALRTVRSACPNGVIVDMTRPGVCSVTSDALRDTMNAWIRSEPKQLSFPVKMADLDADPALHDCANYYPDGRHPAYPTGQAEYERIIEAAVE